MFSQKRKEKHSYIMYVPAFVRLAYIPVPPSPSPLFPYSPFKSVPAKIRFEVMLEVFVSINFTVTHTKINHVPAGNVNPAPTALFEKPVILTEVGTPPFGMEGKERKRKVKRDHDEGMVACLCAYGHLDMPTALTVNHVRTKPGQKENYFSHRRLVNFTL